MEYRINQTVTTFNIEIIDDDNIRKKYKIRTNNREPIIFVDDEGALRMEYVEETGANKTLTLTENRSFSDDEGRFVQWIFCGFPDRKTEEKFA